jgi:hypothetical protein
MRAFSCLHTAVSACSRAVLPNSGGLRTVLSVKMDDGFNRMLRLETTTNNVSFFEHHRKVEHRGGHESREIAPLRKTIYSLIDLREILLGCNRRDLEYLCALDDFSAGDRHCVGWSTPRRSTAIASRASTASMSLSRPCCGRFSVPSSTSVASAVPTSSLSCARSRRPASRASFGAGASSASSRRSFMAIAITSPVWAARPSPPLVESRNNPSSRLSPTLPRDQICSGNGKMERSES